MRLKNRLVGGAFLLIIRNACQGALPVLSPTLDADLPGGASVVYCPTLQVAWDGLKGVVGGPVRMERQGPLADRLNAARLPWGIVPEDASVALAGFVKKGVVADLEVELERKFGDDSPRLPAEFYRMEDGILSYAFLHRRLPFPHRFERATVRPLRFKGEAGFAEVEFFGASPKNAGDYQSSAEILYYGGPDDFTLRLSTAVEGEVIVLSKMVRPRSLQAGVDLARAHLKTAGGGSKGGAPGRDAEPEVDALSRGDLLVIPVVSFGLAQDLPPLCDRHFLNDGFEEAWLDRVYQNVLFSMDETGAEVRSEAYGAGPFGDLPESPSPPRRFVFDRPFLLTVWKSGAQLPYLAVWVASADVLVPFDGSK